MLEEQDTVFAGAQVRPNDHVSFLFLDKNK